MNFLFRKDLIKMNSLITILIIFVIIYFFILISTYVFQRNLLYNPNENNYSGDKLDVSIIKVKIITQDDILTLNNQAKPDKSEILVLDRMIEQNIEYFNQKKLNDYSV